MSRINGVGTIAVSEAIHNWDVFEFLAKVIDVKDLDSVGEEVAEEIRRGGFA